MNANQVFYWRKLYGAGRLGNSDGALKLLPVTVEASPSAPSAISGERASASSPGMIHIKLTTSEDVLPSPPRPDGRHRTLTDNY
ncbi:MAG: hypothetical protein WA188_12150 [Terriglobales bacterium]